MSGGLLESILSQDGGADSYGWHRAESNIVRNGKSLANAHSHLLAEKKLPWEDQPKTGEQKRAEWIKEVRDVMSSTGLNWRDSLKEASRRRQQKIPRYQTVVERVKSSYTGRSEANVACSGPKCPGKYNKDIIRDTNGEVVYRPNAHNQSKRLLSQNAAIGILRSYYRKRTDLKNPTKAMRQDIGKLNRSRILQSSCPTKKITVTNKNGKVYQRRVVDKTNPLYKECRSNWLYRGAPNKFDIEGIDAGEGRNGPAYGKHKLHRSRSRT